MKRYRVRLTKDAEAGKVVAEVPALGIATQGADVPEALDTILAMVVSHVEGRQDTGEPVPHEMPARVCEVCHKAEVARVLVHERRGQVIREWKTCTACAEAQRLAWVRMGAIQASDSR